MTQAQLAFLEEILSQPGFRAWATGEAPEMDDFWNSRAGDDPSRKEVLAYAKSITASFHDAPDPVSDEYILEKISLAVAVGSPEASSGPMPSRKSPVIRIGALLKVAASVLLAACLGWGVYAYYDTEPPSGTAEAASIQSGSPDIPIITVRNTGNTRRHIHLSDGSSVVLQPGTVMRFPETFSGDKREVHLSGEAFFEIVKNKDLPFYVMANQMITKVIGTSFRLKAKPGTPYLEVNVKSGTVAIFKDRITASHNLNSYPQNRVTVLNQNEKAVFELSGDELRQQTQIGEISARLLIEKLSFVYESAPLQTVFTDLEAAYGVAINYDPQLFSGCSLTAELGDEPLAQKIKWIAAILEANYTISENEIIIDGKPCR